MFHLYLAALWAFVVWRIVLPFPLRPGWKLGIAAALGVLAQHHLVQRVVFGTMFSPELPFPIIAIAGWGFCAMVLLAVLTALMELAIFAARLTGAGFSQERSNAARLVLVGVSLLLSGFGVVQSWQVPVVRTVELEIDGLPATLDGFRLVQLSDLHISRFLPAAWATAVVERTNLLQPDLIAVTGDLIDGTVNARAADVAPLGALRARHGVIAIPGNHEYYFDESGWASAFRRLGIKMLVNEHAQIGQPGTGLVIAGIADEAALAYGLPGPDLQASLRGVRAGAPVILLSHRPVNVRTNAQAGVALQLSGHTHGGMIRGLDAVVRHANSGYVSGLYQVSGMRLYVSNGTGIWNGFPIRLGVPAEITEFVLRTRAGN